MRVGAGHLTYCTNIHAGETWEAIRANLGQHVPAVKQRVCPDAPFGLGLRLSAVAAQALAAPAVMDEFLAFLRTNDLYVFTLNGFPYGPFHGTRVKEDVYLPDWRDPARLAYSNQLADLLATLLAAGGLDHGSISTVPGAFKPNAESPADRAAIADLLIRHAAHLVGIERRTGRRIALALEPEPCCMVETIAETVDFFRAHLHSDAAAERLGALTRLARSDAQSALRRHLAVCVDLCHAAVEFEDAGDCFSALAAAGIDVAKIQVTAGLGIPQVDADAVHRLARMADGVYLHQVVERGVDGLTRYRDIDQAVAAARWQDSPCEWRVHFHVPVYLDALDACVSTQPFVREVLAAHRRAALATQLEVETYTWSVLPEAARAVPIDEAIARELQWTLRALQ
mgnify:CR=1 FL=1